MSEGRLPSDYIAAARVPDSVPSGSFGLWTIKRCQFGDDVAGRVQIDLLGCGELTMLCKVTLATLHLEGGGEIVMEDSPRELRRHMPIWVSAHGRVLVTGLGLGCVVRGLLANERVERIDVIEIDASILQRVGAEFASDPRVVLHKGDALTWRWPSAERFDFAWHDLHVDDGVEPGLQALHAKLIVNYAKIAGRQGAWMLPRFFKRGVRVRGKRTLG